MRVWYRSLVGLSLVVVLAGCGGGSPSPTAGTPTDRGDPVPTATPQDIMAIDRWALLEPGPYFIDPDGDPSTPLRVEYTVAAEGWLQWIGATRHEEYGHVGVSIATITNVMRHGCSDQSPADPPVGPTVDDLANALAELAPFRVTSLPTDVTIYGHTGKHLKLEVPDLPVVVRGGETTFTGCPDGNLRSWIAPVVGEQEADEEAYWGYEGPGYTEEFWILDVDGTRLAIIAKASAGAPEEHLAELRAILDSVRIET